MKKFLMTALLGVTIAATSFASENNHNANARRSFNRNYTSVENVTWAQKSGFNTATFVESGVVTEVFYNEAGQEVATCKKVQLADLPEEALQNFYKRYGGLQVNEVISYQDKERFLYFIAGNTNRHQMVVKVDGSSVSLHDKKSL